MSAAYENIPYRMQQCPNWIVWKLEGRGEKKPTKIPYSVYGSRADVTKPNTWATFKEAVQTCQAKEYSGIGFVFTGTPFIGVDIDGCIDGSTGEVSSEATEAIAAAKSYTEFSQSGGGFHIILEGKLPAGRRRNGAFEMYGDGSPRYFAMTGTLWMGYREIRADQEVIDKIHSDYIEPLAGNPQEEPSRQPICLSNLSDYEIIERAGAASNGSEFTALWEGDVSAYGDDDSRADLALCNILAFWCQRDAAKIDRLFRQSGLMRQKWDEKRGKDTYGNITIQKAIEGCREVYDPQHGRLTAQQDFQNIPGASDLWEPPIPFEVISAPDFPIKCLPGPVADFVEALSESTQTPGEMAAVLSLGVLATAFQSRFDVEINPDWKEPLCLYAAAVALPGERKSAVISSLTRPILDYEAARRDLEAEELEQNKQAKRMLEKAVANAENVATKTPAAGRRKGKDEEVEADFKESSAWKKAVELNDELTNFKEMHPFRLLVDDTTPEKLVDIMDKHNGCITVASSEGGVFDSLTGRYDKGANFDVYLKGHAGESIIVDRIGRAPNYIKDSRLTMILTIQPEVLCGLMNNATFKGRGLCGRFLYAVCKSRVGERNVNPDPIPQRIKDEYRSFVLRILSGTDTGTIRLSEGARRSQLKYSELIEKRLGNEWEFMRDWGGKVVGAMLRIAALIHASEVQGDPTEIPISADVIDSAIQITEALGVHAMAAYQVMGADEENEEARYLWKRIESTGQDEMTKNQLIQLTRGKFRKADEMEPALQSLVEMGYIKRELRKTGGRPSEIIIVNPLQ